VFIATDRNGPAADLFARAGFQQSDGQHGGSTWLLPANAVRPEVPAWMWMSLTMRSSPHKHIVWIIGIRTAQSTIANPNGFRCSLTVAPYSFQCLVNSRSEALTPRHNPQNVNMDLQK
jgi:hypothetical protein